MIVFLVRSEAELREGEGECEQVISFRCLCYFQGDLKSLIRIFQIKKKCLKRNENLGAEFVTKVKESISASDTDEDFLIPRPAFDALATEYDILLDEVASLKVNLLDFINIYQVP